MDDNKTFYRNEIDRVFNWIWRHQGCHERDYDCIREGQELCEDAYKVNDWNKIKKVLAGYEEEELQMKLMECINAEI